MPAIDGDVLDAAEKTDLERRHRHVLEQRARLFLDAIGIDGENAATPTVSWTVSAVITDNGWQPNADKVIRSACIPAPPDGSLAAKVRTIGGDGVAWRGS
jgi:hypothetical protein